MLERHIEGGLQGRSILEVSRGLFEGIDIRRGQSQSGQSIAARRGAVAPTPISHQQSSLASHVSNNMGGMDAYEHSRLVQSVESLEAARWSDLNGYIGYPYGVRRGMEDDTVTLDSQSDGDGTEAGSMVSDDLFFALNAGGGVTYGESQLAARTAGPRQQSSTQAKDNGTAGAGGTAGGAKGTGGEEAKEEEEEELPPTFRWVEIEIV